jgi:peptidoglycan/LPS O-acetylase OafA/YrhL
MGVLRFLLASLVAFAHCGMPLWGYTPISPVVPVELFFIISGFYMSLVIDRKYQGMKNYSLFISNRFLRLFPSYWFVLLAVVIITCISGFLWGDWGRLTIFRDFAGRFSPDLGLLTASNVTLFGQDLALFGGLNPANGSIHFLSNYMLSDPPLYRFLLIPQAWSLSVEFLFYLVAPFLVNRRWQVIVSVILTSLGLRAYIYFGLHWANDPWLYRFFPTELALFLLGALAYKIYQKIEPLDLPKPLLVAPGLVVFAAIFIHPLIPMPSWTMYNAINWAIYGFAVVALPFLFKWTKDSKFDAAIGEFSYPIYIAQFIVIDFFLKILKGTPVYGYLPIFVIIGCVAVAWLVNKIVAEPIEKIRKARTPLKS